MEVHVKDSLKIVEIWLASTEVNNAELHRSLQPLYEKYHKKKYKVAVFESGPGDLFDSTAGLLLHNRGLT